MAEDTSFSHAIRDRDEGNLLEVGSTGQQDVYGALDVKSGGELDIESGGVLKIAGTQVTASATRLNTAGTYELLTETMNNLNSSTAGSTGFSDLSNSGFSFLSSTGSTGAGSVGFRLPAPTAGLQKIIAATNVSTSIGKAIVETTGTGIVFGTTGSTAHGNYHRLTFDAAEECVMLGGLSTTKWLITSNVGSVAVSTDFTT